MAGGPHAAPTQKDFSVALYGTGGVSHYLSLSRAHKVIVICAGDIQIPLRAMLGVALVLCIWDCDGILAEALLSRARLDRASN